MKIKIYIINENYKEKNANYKKYIYMFANWFPLK